MKKSAFNLFAGFILAVSAFLAPNAFASSKLELATDSNFHNQTLNFSVGQTIYVRVNSSSNGDLTHQLNLKDNRFNQIASYNLINTGSNQFQTNFSAPAPEGYYSLEAVIESVGSSQKSVKTIKVGNVQNANINVNVKSNVSGSTSANSSQQIQSTPTSSPTIEGQVLARRIKDSSGDISEEIIIQNEPSANVGLIISLLIQKIFSLFGFGGN